MEEAPGKLKRSQKTHMEILQGFLEVECVVGGIKQWLSMAKDILRRNSIPEADFTEAVQSLIVKGRGKYRNILLKGPANCGTTFILKSHSPRMSRIVRHSKSRIFLYFAKTFLWVYLFLFFIYILFYFYFFFYFLGGGVLT